MSEAALPIQYLQYMRHPKAEWAVFDDATVEWKPVVMASMTTASLPPGSKVARFEFVNDPVLKRMMTRFDVNADGTLTLLDTYVSDVRLSESVEDSDLEREFIADTRRGSSVGRHSDGALFDEENTVSNLDYSGDALISDSPDAADDLSGCVSSSGEVNEPTDRHAWIYDRTRVERGAIYNNPPRCRCGECGRVVALIDNETSCDAELRKLGWKYFSQSGWVCTRCKPLERFTTGPNRVFEDEVQL